MPYNDWYFGLNLGQLQSEVLRKLWVQFEEDSSGFPMDTAAAFSKFTEYRINLKLNKHLAKLVGYGNLLRQFFIITLKTNYSQYPVPHGCIDLEEKVYYFDSATTYTKLDVVERSRLEDLYPGWLTATGTPEYCYAGDWAGTFKKLGVAPAPTADGTTPTLVAGTYQKTTPLATVEGVSGAAGPGSATNTYSDADGRNMATLGVFIGQTIKNVSDGSSGVITSVSGTDIICSAGLSGGTNNIWTPADEMKVFGGEYMEIITIGDLAADFLVAPNVGQFPAPGITMAAGNLLVGAYFLPVQLSDRDQYPQLSPILHDVLVLGVAAELAEEQPVDTPLFAQSKVYWQRYAAEAQLAKPFFAQQYKQLAMTSDRRGRSGRRNPY